VFLFSHLTYFVQLLYRGKLSRPTCQQKLSASVSSDLKALYKSVIIIIIIIIIILIIIIINKIMKILQEDVILIKNLYLSKQYGARRLLSELPDKGWKL